MSKDDERVKSLRRRANKVRKFPHNTCPASRHLHIMAEGMLKGGYPMLQEEPEHCAESILATIAALWEARTALAKINGISARPTELNVRFAAGELGSTKETK